MYNSHCYGLYNFYNFGSINISYFFYKKTYLWYHGMLTRYANLYNFSFNNQKKNLYYNWQCKNLPQKKKKNQNDEGLKSV